MKILKAPKRVAYGALALTTLACAAATPAESPPVTPKTVAETGPQPVSTPPATRLPRFPVPSEPPKLIAVAYASNMYRWVPTEDDFAPGDEAAIFCTADTADIHCATMKTVSSFARSSEHYSRKYEGGARGNNSGRCFLVPLADGRGRKGCKESSDTPASLAAYAASGQWKPPEPVDFYFDLRPLPQKLIRDFLDELRSEAAKIPKGFRRQLGHRALNLQRAALGLIDEAEHIADDAKQISGWATMRKDGAIDGELTIVAGSKTSWLFGTLTELRKNREADWKSFWRLPGSANVAAVSFYDINWQVPVIEEFREALRGVQEDQVSASMIDRFFEAGMLLGDVRSFASEFRSKDEFWAIAAVPDGADAFVAALEELEAVSPNKYTETKRPRGLPGGSYVLARRSRRRGFDLTVVPTPWKSTWLVASRGIKVVDLYKQVRQGKDLGSSAALRDVAPTPSESKVSFFATLASPGYAPATLVTRVEDANTPKIVTSFRAPKGWLTGMTIHAISAFDK